MRTLWIVAISSFLVFSNNTLADVAVDNTIEGLHARWIDHHANLQKNFYQFATGAWRHRHHLPQDVAVYQGLIDKVEQQNELQIEDIILGLIHSPTLDPLTVEQKIVNFYLSGMDQATIDQLGLQPIQPELNRISALRTQDDLIKEIVHLQKMGIGAPFNITPHPDFFGSDSIACSIASGDLGLPDKIYYTDDSYYSVRVAYEQHIANMLVLLSEAPHHAAIAAKSIMAMETAFAKAEKNVDLFDVIPIKIDVLPQVMPKMNWRLYFSLLKQPNIQEVNVFNSSLNEVVNQLSSRSIAEWQEYFRWQVLHAFAPYLSQPFVTEHFHLTQVLKGVKVLPARSLRVTRAEGDVFGDALGKLYVAQHFSIELKSAAEAMVAHIRGALRDDLTTLPWLSEAGRQAAIKKLDAMTVHVGAPDHWTDYSALQMDANHYLMNVMRAKAFNVSNALDAVGKPFNRNGWLMAPQTANAYYVPLTNSITVPAGILQPPLFDPKAPDVVNYARLGYIIGHEITHGFDDFGSLFDENGKMNEWLPKEDQAKFTAAARCITQQYSQFFVYSNNGQTDRVFEPGQKVTGEAIADMGGATLAYRALHMTPADGNPYAGQTMIKGYTLDQWFFLNIAQLWAAKIHPEAQVMLLGIDEHSLPKFRINGMLANMPEFQQAFDIPAGTIMARDPRCVIW